VTILYIKSCSIQNAHPYLQVLSGASDNAFEESESSLLSSSGDWEHLEVLRTNGEVAQSVGEDCVIVLNWLTSYWYGRCGTNIIQSIISTMLIILATICHTVSTTDPIPPGIIFSVYSVCNSAYLLILYSKANVEAYSTHRSEGSYLLKLYLDNFCQVDWMCNIKCNRQCTGE
jgi:hypothetical protein